MGRRVLITDAGTAAALAAARSLDRAGYRVTVVASSRHDAAAASRAVTSVVRAPDPLADSEGWIARVARALTTRRFDLFLPVTDGALLLADRIRDRIPPWTAAALPPAGQLALLLDKRAVLDRAAALGIPVLPRRGPDRLEGAPLPAVVKPGRSRVIGYGRVLAATALVAGDPRVLAAEVDRLVRAGHGAYVEPWVPGEGRGIFLLLHRGEVLARFAHRRIRESSPLGGPSAVAESTPADPELLRWSSALARDLGVEGPFMAEFRGLGEDTVLLEVNARCWGSLALAVAAGVDFPALYAAALLGAPRRGPESWRTGLRCRNLALDLNGLLRVALGPPRGVRIPWPRALAAAGRLLGTRARGMFLIPGDPAPARAHLLSLLARIRCHA
jgi:predicted ATP-grasp superfamily ATP-dependent carboligase